MVMERPQSFQGRGTIGHFRNGHEITAPFDAGFLFQLG